MGCSTHSNAMLARKSPSSRTSVEPRHTELQFTKTILMLARTVVTSLKPKQRIPPIIEQSTFQAPRVVAAIQKRTIRKSNPPSQTSLRYKKKTATVVVVLFIMNYNSLPFCLLVLVLGVESPFCLFLVLGVVESSVCVYGAGMMNQSKSDSFLSQLVVCVFVVINPFEVQALLRIPIPVAATEDKLIWTPTSSSDLYQHILNSQASSSNSSHASSFKWMKLWSVRRIAPRIILFIWNGGLAVYSNLARICGCCEEEEEEEEETMDHVLLQCRTARAAWLASALITNSTPSNNMTVDALLSQLINQVDLKEFRLSCALLWVIWKPPNSLVFNNKVVVQVDEMVRQASLLFMNYNPPIHNNADTVEVDLTIPKHHQQFQMRWSPPSSGFVKINVDGAYVNSRLAAAAVARDNHGTFIGCATSFLNFGLPIEAEASAFILGIDLATKLYLTHIIFEGDYSMEFVRSITDDSFTCNWRVHSQIQVCRSFKASRDDVSLAFSSRSTNGAAHALAAFIQVDQHKVATTYVLDVTGVAYVINLDLPKTTEDHVHWIGRTGRAGSTEQATSFCTYRDMFLVPQIWKAITDMESGNSVAFTTGKRVVLEPVMAGRDMIRRAITGSSGKTLAFGIPILDKTIQNRAPGSSRQGAFHIKDYVVDSWKLRVASGNICQVSLGRDLLSLILSASQSLFHQVATPYVLDVTGVAYVINLDLPKTTEDYVHRIGRTGRAGSTGQATSFYTDRDMFLVPHIRKEITDVESGNSVAFATGKAPAEELEYLEQKWNLIEDVILKNMVYVHNQIFGSSDLVVSNITRTADCDVPSQYILFQPSKIASLHQILLEELIQTSIGKFKKRLQLLFTFHGHISSGIRLKSDSSAFLMFRLKILYNIFGYYVQIFHGVLEHIKAHKRNIVGDLKLFFWIRYIALYVVISIDDAVRLAARKI